jgi:hypothetical protein
MYTSRVTASGHIDIIRAENAHLPHASVSWYDGGIYTCTIVPMRPGDSVESIRAHYEATRVPPCGRGTCTVRIAQWVA